MLQKVLLQGKNLTCHFLYPRRPRGMAEAQATWLELGVRY